MANQSSLNNRVIGAVFFGVFALLFLFFAKYTVLSLYGRHILPLFPALFYAVFLGALTGTVFGVTLAQPGRWWRAVLWGILIAVLVLLAISLGTFLHTYYYDPAFMSRAQHWQDYFVIFGVIFLSMLLVLGLWLIPLLALAALYFNQRFIPGIRAVEQRQIHASKAVKTTDDDSQ
ncbi:hypothetical protein [Legionella taurinensis]|uniref:Transmembrane protein n=1 Tax=Legionella taurinensis TaxID=70611 RepID=A0A3A5L5C4_9GAMM|nr:hypothetical protein [Legionella taurinensis]RJT47993.1 hypothetical protein D6J04_05345 [Legionella taurinensis]RJT68207.1 hypothetical protein D6J03_05470 [Legionella taurinensis]STY25611.1 Uncharacterised protein [Legionella taurinensis]